MKANLNIVGTTGSKISNDSEVDFAARRIIIDFYD